MIPFVAVFINSSLEHAKKPLVKRGRTHCSEIVGDVTRDVRQLKFQERANQPTMNAEGTQKDVVKDGWWALRLRSVLLKCCLRDYTVKSIQRLGTQSIWDSSPSDQLNLNFKQDFRRTFPRIWTRLIKTINVMERNYKRSIPYGKQENDMKPNQKGETSTKS